MLWYTVVMRNAKIEKDKICPKCGSIEHQANAGFNRSGTRRCLCFYCKHKYTLEPKRHAYSEEVRQIAIKEYLSGLSGRGVGKVHGMSGNNVINWIKKNSSSVDKSCD